MTPVFFYGLFMDQALLREKGFNPTAPEIACVEGYTLRIGNRATLVPAQGERAYGTVMALEDEELARLYGEEGVADYAPVPVTVFTMGHDAIPATVYTLPEDRLSGRNSRYLRSLVGIARKVGLPDDYIRELESMESDA